MTNAKGYMKLKFYVENNAIELAIFTCMFYLAVTIGESKETLLGIVLIAFPVWFFFREKVSNDILLLPISHKEMKNLNKKYRFIKFIEWMSFGLISFVLQKFSESWAYSIVFLMIFSIIYIIYVFTKFIKREF